jgi:hypothetical protein
VLAVRLYLGDTPTAVSARPIDLDRRGASRRELLPCLSQADNVESLLVDRQLPCPVSLRELVRRRLPAMRQRRFTVGIITEQAPLFLLH